MSFPRYGVLSGRIVRFHREIRDRTPHFQLEIDARGQQWRTPINVRSRLRPSEVLYVCIRDFKAPVIQYLGSYPDGYTEIGSGSRRGLDYLRGEYFDPHDVVALPHHRRGPDNDIQDLLTHFSELGRDRSQKAKLYVFGQPTVDHGRISGLHDIHMNQGNHPAFQQDDGVWQDGGLILHLPEQKRYMALFICFQSQALKTDDTTGHAKEGSSIFEEVINGALKNGSGKTSGVRILTALVDPPGPDNSSKDPESVTILNCRPKPLHLDQWKILNQVGQVMPLDGHILEPYDTLRVENSTDDFSLGNNGGNLVLMDPQEREIHQVSWKKNQIIEGRTVIFEP